jgi:hypothetical protein
LADTSARARNSTAVVFWKIDDVKQSTEGLDNEETGGKMHRRFLLRFYRVWNVEQCELPQGVLDKLPKTEVHEHDPIEAAERIITDMPNRPETQYTGSKAFYSSITDRVTLPPRELFTSAEEFYATALHETIHYADIGIIVIAPGVRNALREKGSVKLLRSDPPSTQKRNYARKWAPLTFAPRPASQPQSSRIRPPTWPVGSNNGELAITLVISRKA